MFSVNKLSPPTPNLEQLLMALTREVVVGRTHLEIAKRIRETDPAVMATALTFFGLTHNAHLDAAQMIAAKLYDNTKNAITVRSVLDAAERVAGTFPHASAQDVRLIVGAAKKQIEEFENILTVLDARRNEYLAHIDVNTVIDRKEIFNRTKLTFDELDQLFIDTLNILNDISQWYIGTLAVPALPDSDDCENVFRIIKDKLETATDGKEK